MQRHLAEIDAIASQQFPHDLVGGHVPQFGGARIVRNGAEFDAPHDRLPPLRQAVEINRNDTGGAQIPAIIQNDSISMA